MELVLTHRGELIGYALRIVGNRTTAEDVVQEAYLNFWAHTGTAEATASPVTEPVGYLYRIVRNLALDWRRRPARNLMTQVDGDILERYASENASPETDAIWRQELAAIQDVIDGLPERTRIAFEMHRLGGKTLQEVADHLEVSVTRAHQLIRQALVKCAERLEQLENDGTPVPEKTGGTEKKRGSRV
ncbi:sigma-70 family RNA polymerase sigma factor [Nisaea acidiphila]|uniref:Sigma-70 family RNA polymerase sigma factor n=1 Tax=Nisaea acidiphila TaxID=1862145 RepID=A0A9J7ARU8_9PROT|nr:sigma-70 family RNA polymerase sigma factor [Nisaea acidiphila]UUX49289.1 sigma-70 family RNA polymerase sigma factor [Nisaea acidiphila]